MTNLTVKRIYDPPSPDDGFRVLVDRLWPRGVPKATAAVDWWAKDITPTTALRQAYHGGQCSWTDFATAYGQELGANPALDDIVTTLARQPTVTLMTAVKDPDHSHVPVLLGVLQARMTN